MHAIGEKVEEEVPNATNTSTICAEYRRRIIELAQAGRSIDELARDFEAPANAIRKWVKQAALDEDLSSDGLTTIEPVRNVLPVGFSVLQFEQCMKFPTNNCESFRCSPGVGKGAARSGVGDRNAY